jgi:general secretion pathway protein B
VSFILDALKKSESDRQRQSTPALFEVKVAAPRRRYPLWIIGLGALLAVNIVVLIWVLTREPSGVPAQSVAQQQPATPAQAAAPPPAPVPNAVTGPGGITMVPATVYIPVGTAPAATPNIPEAGVVAPSNAPPLAEEPLLSGREPVVPPDYDARDYAPALTPAQANVAAASRSNSLPSRDELVANGTAIPDLRLDLHVYDPNPAKRFVFINMHKLREGESMAEGVRVDAITQNGAQLSYRGARFSIDGN